MSAKRRWRRRAQATRGASVFEMLIALVLMAIAGGITIAGVDRAVTEVREAGGARAFAMRVRQIRAEAVRRSAAVGLRFASVQGGMVFQAHLDGNGNGLRTGDIASGVDPPLAPAATLADFLPGTTFAVGSDVPLLGDDDRPSDPDPVRLGAANLLSFGPTGSGTSGTVILTLLGPAMFTRWVAPTRAAHASGNEGRRTTRSDGWHRSWFTRRVPPWQEAECSNTMRRLQNRPD
jgi:Type II transport protein GspH